MNMTEIEVESDIVSQVTIAVTVKIDLPTTKYSTLRAI